MRFEPGKTYTFGETLGPAMAIEDQAEADAYFEDLIEMSMRANGKARAECEKIERSNLGYYAGYYDQETRLRVERLFRCSHPVFGAASGGAPTAEQAFQKGLEIGGTAAQEGE